MFRFRKHFRERIWLTLTAVAMLAVAACGGSQGSSKTVDGVITAWPADLTTQNPSAMSTPQGFEFASNVYQGLVSFKFDRKGNGTYTGQGSDVQPALATRWDMGETSVTFHLDPEAKFYPTGNPVTADDVKWTLGAILESPNAGNYTANGLQSENDVIVVDRHTVTIKFKDKEGNGLPVTPTLLAIYGSPASGIIDSVEANRHATSDDPYATKWLDNNTAGTGPYYVAEREVGQQLVLKAVPGLKVAPAYGIVTIRIVNGASIAGLLKGGTINFGEYNLAQSDINQLGDAGFSVVSEDAPQLSYLALASNTGQLQDAKVRQAIAYAVPYDEIIDSVYFGRAKRALSYVPVTSSAYTPAWECYRTDFDHARRLMREAGSPKISIPLYYNSSEKTQEDIAIHVESGLAKIGIEVTLSPRTRSQMFDVINSRSQPQPGAPVGMPAIVLFNWGAWIDDPKIPVGYATTTGGVNNYSLWSNPEVDSIDKRFALAPATHDRDEAYKRAQALVAEGVPLVPIVTAQRSMVMVPGMSGASFPVQQITRFWLLEPTR